MKITPTIILGYKIVRSASQNLLKFRPAHHFFRFRLACSKKKSVSYGSYAHSNLGLLLTKKNERGCSNCLCRVGMSSCLLPKTLALRLLRSCMARKHVRGQLHRSTMMFCPIPHWLSFVMVMTLTILTNWAIACMLLEWLWLSLLCFPLLSREK